MIATLPNESAILALDAQDECFEFIIQRFKALIEAGIVGIAHADCLCFDEAKLVSDVKAFVKTNAGKKLFAVFHDSLGGVTDHPNREQADQMNKVIQDLLESFGIIAKIIYAKDNECALEMADYVGEVVGVTA